MKHLTINPRALLSFAAGAAVAIVGMITFQAVTADAITAGESTFVPMTPCRLFDTRPGASNVGPRSTPIGPDSSMVVRVRGSNGECVIPNAATAVAINLTGVSPTAQTNLRMYPAGAPVPNAAVLNMSAGQAPLPNKLDVKLSANGRVAIYNRFGSIHVIGDVLGYYRNDGLADLEARLAALEGGGGGAGLTARVAALETLTDSMRLATPPETDHPTLVFEDVNVQVYSGDPFADNGRGNLIVGRNIERDGGNVRTGSHNVIIGDGHSYSSDYGLLVGENNTAQATGAFVAGNRNRVAAKNGAIAGGGQNVVTGVAGSILGGSGNTASGETATVTGGVGNSASGKSSTMLGGSALTCTAPSTICP